MKKIGIIGCGTIGSALAEAIRTRFAKSAKLIGVYDRDIEKAKRLGRYLAIDKLIDAADIVIESASFDAAREVVPLALRKKKEILVMSTGGLLGMPLQRGIHIPGGAIGGLDGVLSAAYGKIKKIALTTRKPPKSLGLAGITKETVIFQGRVGEAVKLFPQNINVCATLALVSGKPELIKVKIIACPGLKRNTHEVVVEGGFGRMTCITENKPSKTNPKTSYLAILSAISTLDKMIEG